MSPEQGSGRAVTTTSDIYSLGIILYELLAGRVPFDADTPWGIIHHHLYVQPPPLQQVRPGLTAQTYRVVEMCLQKEPSARYQDAGQLMAALDQAMAAETANPLAHQPASRATIQGQLFERPVTTIVQRRWRPATLAVPALVLVLALLVGRFIWGGGRNGEPTAEPAQTDAPGEPTIPPSVASLPTSTVRGRPGWNWRLRRWPWLRRRLA
jgi:hypothetical protein